MMLNPWTLGLVTGQGALLFVVSLAVFNARDIVKKWDFDSHSEMQYRLEKKTYLISTGLKFALMVQVLMLLLLIVAADELSHILPGAMCATGTFSSNGYGFPLLWIEILSSLIFFIWLVLDYLDNQTETYTFIKEKYSFLIAFYPLVIVKFILLLLFTYQLDPGIITSCCGSVYNETSIDIGGIMAGLSPKVTLSVFFGIIALLSLQLFWEKYTPNQVTGLKGFSGIFLWGAYFVVAISVIISWISTYIYELPTHNCPFCFLKGEYNHIGVPIYIALLGATGTGLARSTLFFFKGHHEISRIWNRLHFTLGWAACVMVVMFMIFGFTPFILYYLKTGTLI